ncbi:hypothetical protein C5C33_06020 [Rathayibacter sp. AY1H3]|nr:hypothetical protein C5C33_06020 [Rathayibacter sp. AY1H3]
MRRSGAGSPAGFPEPVSGRQRRAGRRRRRRRRRGLRRRRGRGRGSRGSPGAGRAPGAEARRRSARVPGRRSPVRRPGVASGAPRG